MQALVKHQPGGPGRVSHPWCNCVSLGRRAAGGGRRPGRPKPIGRRLLGDVGWMSRAGEPRVSAAVVGAPQAGCADGCANGCAMGTVRGCACGCAPKSEPCAARSGRDARNATTGAPTTLAKPSAASPTPSGGRPHRWWGRRRAPMRQMRMVLLPLLPVVATDRFHPSIREESGVPAKRVRAPNAIAYSGQRERRDPPYGERAARGPWVGARATGSAALSASVEFFVLGTTYSTLGRRSSAAPSSAAASTSLDSHVGEIIWTSPEAVARDRGRDGPERAAPVHRAPSRPRRTGRRPRIEKGQENGPLTPPRP